LSRWDSGVCWQGQFSKGERLWAFDRLTRQSVGVRQSNDVRQPNVITQFVNVGLSDGGDSHSTNVRKCTASNSLTVAKQHQTVNRRQSSCHSKLNDARQSTDVKQS